MDDSIDARTHHREEEVLETQQARETENKIKKEMIESEHPYASTTHT